MRWSRSAVTRACPLCATISLRCRSPMARQVAAIFVIKDANLDDRRHAIVDAVPTHEFCGNQLVDVSRNGQLRDAALRRRCQQAPGGRGAHQGGAVS